MEKFDEAEKYLLEAIRLALDLYGENATELEELYEDAKKLYEAVGNNTLVAEYQNKLKRII